MSDLVEKQKSELVDAISRLDNQDISLFAAAAESQGACLGGFLTALVRCEAGKEFIRKLESDAKDE